MGVSSPPRDAPPSAQLGRGTPGARHGQWTEDRVRPRHGRVENSAQLPLCCRGQRLHISGGDDYRWRARCRNAGRAGQTDVDLGGIRIQGHPVAVLDAAMLEFPLGRTSPLETSGRTSSHELDGVLGWNAIRELRITLDNDRRVLLFEPPRHGATSRSGSASPSSAPGRGTGFPSLCSSTRQMRGRLSPRRSPGQLGFAVGAMRRSW